jgi:exosome complex component RRP4
VRPVRSRYVGDVGDVVVGRITELQQSKWKVDIAGRQDAVLQLGAVNLPGAARRRTIEDQLQMRSLFVENDVIVAEAQSFFQDGSVALQVGRDMGKLENGIFVSVSSSLIKRSKTHFHTIAGAVDVIIGMNGCIWLSASLSDEEKEVKAIQGKNYVSKPVPREDREKIARVRNCIAALAERNLPIHPDTITECYRASLKYDPKHLITPEVVEIITKPVQLSL